MLPFPELEKGGLFCGGGVVLSHDRWCWCSRWIRDMIHISWGYPAQLTPDSGVEVFQNRSW